jgi:hypothetical protein
MASRLNNALPKFVWRIIPVALITFLNLDMVAFSSFDKYKFTISR